MKLNTCWCFANNKSTAPEEIVNKDKGKLRNTEVGKESKQR